jgi:NAD-dependent DNA ligase
VADLYGEFESSKFFHSARIDRRSADALVGLAAGLASDGIVSTPEAVFLKDWLETNLVHLDDPVINLLYTRLSVMLRDGALDAEESSELLSLLQSFSGLRINKPKASDNIYTAPNGLPLNHPEPELVWSGRVFVFTGIMAYGPRKDCQLLVEERGGIIAPGISKKIHYLVVGSIGNEQWRHSSYGTKIMKAVELRESGSPIAIIGEQQWQHVLFG